MLEFLQLRLVEKFLKFRPDFVGLVDANLSTLWFVIHKECLGHDLHGDPQFVAIFVANAFLH